MVVSRLLYHESLQICAYTIMAVFRKYLRNKHTHKMKNSRFMHQVILCLILVPLLSACGLVLINDIGYRSLTAEQRKRVVKCEVPIDSLRSDGLIYLIRSEQLQDYLNRQQKVLIYEYRSFCSSENCVSVQYAEKLCEEMGVNPCIVNASYYHLSMLDGVQTPILAPDFNHYKTSNDIKLTRRFFDELTHTTRKERGYTILLCV